MLPLRKSLCKIGRKRLTADTFVNTYKKQYVFNYLGNIFNLMAGWWKFTVLLAALSAEWCSGAENWTIKTVKFYVCCPLQKVNLLDCRELVNCYRNFANVFMVTNKKKTNYN